MELALIPPGEFLMGSSDADVAAALAADSSMKTEDMDAERPQHPVRLTKPFRMGVHPVTQREFQQIMGRNPSHFSSTGAGKSSVERIDFFRCPVECVTWFDAVEFCNKLSAREGLPLFYTLVDIVRENGAIQSATVTRASGAVSSCGSGYRLPTEAEWEYSARAGTFTAFHFGNQCLHHNANFDSRRPYGTTVPIPIKPMERTSVVGSYPANGFALRDVCGNVWEWCSDRYDVNFYGQSSGTVVDPECQSSDRRLLRGGSWNDYAKSTRSAKRNRNSPYCRDLNIGFRVSRNQ